MNTPITLLFAVMLGAGLHVNAADIVPLLDAADNADLTPKQAKAYAALSNAPTTQEISVVRIHDGALSANHIELALPSVAAFAAIRAPSNDTVLSWSTDQDVQAEHTVTLYRDGENVTGTVRAGGEVYAIRPIGSGLHALIRLDQTAFPSDHPPAKDHPKPTKRDDRVPLVPRAANHAANEDAIDMLVAYPTSLRSTLVDPEGLIRLAEAETNQGYLNSGVSIRVKVIGIVPTDYSEHNDMNQILENLSDPADGFLDELHKMRDTQRADVLMLVVANRTYCGVARAILASIDEAVAVVSQDCATGYYSFAHELGHLLGALHDPDADPSITPFPYGHGYRNGEKQVRTIMAYDCAPSCPRLNLWSGPTVLFDGSPMGNDECCHDARVLDETGPILAAFR